MVDSDVTPVGFSPNDYLSTMWMWDEKHRAAIVELLVGHSNPVVPVVFAPSSDHIVSGFLDGPIRI